MLSIERRNWSRIVATLFALLLTGSYSIAAALGSASGGRTNATMAEHAITEQRTKLQTSYDAAKAELDGLKPSRPVAEIEALMMGAQWWKPPKGCTADDAKKRVTCPALEGELARSRQRERLKADMERATADLAKTQPAKVANSDASALTGYLSAVGVDVSPDRVNRLLVLLAVLVIEMGGGLALTVGMALSASKPHVGNAESASTVELSSSDPCQQTAARPQRVFGEPDHAPNNRAFAQTPADRDTEHPAPDTSPDAGATMANTRSPEPNTAPLAETNTAAQSDAGVRLLEFVRERGGVLVSGQRQIGKAMGWSASWTHQVLHDLSAAGLVKLTTGKSGTVVQLAA
jgi:hypothetical protein